jgi:hypothetical protein
MTLLKLGRGFAPRFINICGRRGSCWRPSLTIYGADWFGRCNGSCRLHAIYLNQLCVHMEMVGEVVKYGSGLGPPTTTSADLPAPPASTAVSDRIYGVNFAVNYQGPERFAL